VKTQFVHISDTLANNYLVVHFSTACNKIA